MKNFINNCIVLFVLLFFSCKNAPKQGVIQKEQNKQKTFKEHNYKNVSYIDRELDSVIYKLSICSGDDYALDDLGRQTVLLKREIFVGDSCFGGYSNISKALSYAKKKQDEYTRISISILNKKGKFNEVWFWKQISYGDGELAGYIVLDEGYYKYKNHNKKGLKISYDYGFDNYLKLNTLNFIKENNMWKIISRESINTSPEESQHYFIETTNLHGHYSGELSDTFPPSEKVEITNEMIIFY
ncbi:hypothetical protein FNW52_20130 [Flavobacterium sp. ZT3R18]|uniref:hypothetical protein n=1 Tax=Flavobacterium sp. ZT3R18 TaxID=2594429 RepID=UPI00117A0C4F|nr:hypothetical protein [Flavobacterium sp. ZT3R18]TRX30453.1 hypothetical protein FNW52_20130 [Flavobacterium sp. ZT3R18]